MSVALFIICVAIGLIALPRFRPSTMEPRHGMTPVVLAVFGMAAGYAFDGPRTVPGSLGPFCRSALSAGLTGIVHDQWSVLPYTNAGMLGAAFLGSIRRNASRLLIRELARDLFCCIGMFLGMTLASLWFMQVRQSTQYIPEGMFMAMLAGMSGGMAASVAVWETCASRAFGRTGT